MIDRKSVLLPLSSVFVQLIVIFSFSVVFLIVAKNSMEIICGTEHKDIRLLDAHLKAYLYNFGGLI